MAEKKQEKEQEEGDKATPKQVDLVKSLYEETGYKRQYSDDDLFHLPQAEMQTHIDFLIGYKRSQINGSKSREQVNGFNKIEFGMIYKLCWRYCGEHGSPMMAEEGNFLKLVAMEYAQYKKAMAFTKKQVEKKAGK